MSHVPKLVQCHYSRQLADSALCEVQFLGGGHENACRTETEIRPHAALWEVEIQVLRYFGTL